MAAIVDSGMLNFELQLPLTPEQEEHVRHQRDSQQALIVPVVQAQQRAKRVCCSSRRCCYCSAAVVVIVALSYAYVAHLAAASFTLLKPGIWNTTLEGRLLTPQNASMVFTRGQWSLGECASDQMLYSCGNFTAKRQMKLVHFPARPGDAGQDDATLAAWWLPAADPRAPRIVLQNGCCRTSLDHSIMTTSCFLRSLGYGVLAPSYRNVALSQNTTHHSNTWGWAYPFDVLGAWDYAVHDPDGELGGAVSSDHVGIMGFSMGGFTLGSAFGMEPRIPAMWLDGGAMTVYGSLYHGILGQEEMDAGCAIGKLRNCWWLKPRLLAYVVAPGAVRFANWLTGVDMSHRSPLVELDPPPQKDGAPTRRPVALVANAQDETVPIWEQRQYRSLFERRSDLYDLREVWFEDYACGSTTHCNFHAWRPGEYIDRLRRFWGSVFVDYNASATDALPNLSNCETNYCSGEAGPLFPEKYHR